MLTHFDPLKHMASRDVAIFLIGLESKILKRFVSKTTRAKSLIFGRYVYWVVMYRILFSKNFNIPKKKNYGCHGCGHFPYEAIQDNLDIF